MRRDLQVALQGQVGSKGGTADIGSSAEAQAGRHEPKWWWWWLPIIKIRCRVEEYIENHCFARRKTDVMQQNGVVHAMQG
jgi:hypothetical protein